MLRFAKDPDRLFFTTTLQNAIQVYDLERAALLDPVNDHPSPPTVFALSSTSHLLLSASASPTVIQLKNLLLSTRPLLLRPQCSSAVVVVIEFHPERGNVFLLGFADGTCAVYDAAYIFRDGGRGERRSGVSNSGVRWEIAHIKEVHASGIASSQTEKDFNTELHGTDRPRRVSTGDHLTGITAAAFVPGYKTTVVTIGSDGRCCVVDFAVSDAHEPNLVCTWHFGSSAACLSILSQDREDGSALPIAGFRDLEFGHRPVVVAIGCRDGQVLLYDLNGNLLLQPTTATNGTKIIDVAWMEGDDWPELVQHQPKPIIPRKRKSGGSRKSLGSVLANHRPVTEEVVAITSEAGADETSGNALQDPTRSPKSPRIRDGSGLRRTESDSAVPYVAYWKTISVY